MYTVDDLDKLVELPDFPDMCGGAPMPIVVADDFTTVVSYFTSDDNSCFIRFDRANHWFGNPNDEALDGHPLADRGLHMYGFFKVENSSLIRKLERMNSVHEWHKPELFWAMTHYIIPFHDTTFECVAASHSLVVEPGDSWDRFPRAIEMLRARI